MHTSHPTDSQRLEQFSGGEHPVPDHKTSHQNLYIREYSVTSLRTLCIYMICILTMIILSTLEISKLNQNGCKFFHPSQNLWCRLGSLWVAFKRLRQELDGLFIFLRLLYRNLWEWSHVMIAYNWGQNLREDWFLIVFQNILHNDYKRLPDTPLKN